MRLIISILFFCGIALPAFSADTYESFTMQTRYTYNNKISSNSNIKVINNKRFQMSGSGQYFDLKDAYWNVEVEFNDLLKATKSTSKIYDKDDIMRYHFSRIYDYTKKTITFKEQVTGFEQLFPLKGMTTDTYSMLHALRPLVRDWKQHKNDQYFYLLTAEPKLFHMRMYHIEDKDINFKGNKVKVHVFRIIPELGIIDNLMSKILPDFYVYYSTKEPYEWYHYEGLERSDSRKRITFKTLDYSQR